MWTQIRSKTCRRGQVGLAVLALLSGIRPTVTAQATPINPRDTTHSQKQAPFFTAKDAVLAGLFVGATAIMIPLDKQAAAALLDSGTQTNHLFKRVSTGVEAIASPGAYLIGGSMYAVGRLAGSERFADLGLHGTEAVLFAQGITYFVKGFAGRARPFMSNGRDPDDFRFAYGFKSGDWTSFPSGHTATAFAAAAAVTNETSRWWPKSVWIVGPLMYGGATAVGLSRMYHSRHWGSDVAIGAAIGTFSGRKFVQYAHGHPDNRIDRLLLKTKVQPNADGGLNLGLWFKW